MNKILFILFFLIKIHSCLSQTGKIFSDSSIIQGNLRKMSIIGESLDQNCRLEAPTYNLEDVQVFVIRVYKCQNQFNVIGGTFLEIAKGNKNYFVEPRSVEVFEDDFLNKFEKLTSKGKEKFRLMASVEKTMRGLIIENKVTDFVETCKNKGLCVLNSFAYDVSENTHGTGFKVKVLNPTNKIIKYIWFTVTGLNPVGDRVFEFTKQSNSITLKAIGPIEKNDFGTYEFEYVWFTDIVQKAIITNVKVQYMDGSIKIISNPNSVTLPSELFKEYEFYGN